MSTDLPPMGIRYVPLPYEAALEKRAVTQVDLVVMHCTELPDLAMAREFGKRPQYPSGTGNSGHFYLDRDGSIHQFVEPGRVAHHTRGYNPRSIGVELVNRGRYPDWLDSRSQAMDEPYTEAQLDALLKLLAWLRQALPRLQFIAGHEELDTATVPASDDPDKQVHRKRDPGPLFPWERVLLASGLKRLSFEE